MIKKYHLDIDRKKLADIIADGSSADRVWRLALKENKDLQGKDYWDKIDLEIAKRKELGY